MHGLLDFEWINFRLAYRLLASGFLVLFVLLGPHNLVRAQDLPTDFFYYSGGQQISLQPSTSFIAVRFKDGASFQPSASVSSQLAGAELRELNLNKLNLYRLEGAADSKQANSLHSELASTPGVNFVAPVFQTPDALMIVTDEFVVQFAADMSRDVIDSLNTRNGVEIVREFSWSANTYLLRVVQGDCLKTANEYHEMDNVVFAHPNFVRVTDRLRPGASIDTAPLTLGKDQQTLPAAISKAVRDNDLKEPVPVAPTVPVPMAPVARTVIKTEGFEGAFPNDWYLFGDPTWDDASYGLRVYSGDWNGYCVGGGSSGVLPPGPYPNNVNSSLVYGPFDLSDAEDARIVFRTWVKTEYNFDFFGAYVSTDGTNFSGSSLSGDWAGFVGGAGFMNWSVDLKNTGYGDLRGESSVWVAFVFTSDTSATYEGVYLDDIVIEKITGGYESLTSDQYDHLQWSLENNGQLWGTEGADIGAKNAWSISQGKSIVIAIIDEGVDLTHPDLNLVAGYDATMSGSSGGPSGDDAHGTNCAGVAAAITDNGKGVAGIAGRAKVMPIRIAYGDGGGGWVYTDAWAADGIAWAADNGADVLSNSWGGGSPATILDDALSHARTNGRDGKGCLVLFASGNDNGSVSYPATNSDVMAVGALSPCDERTNPDSCDGEFWWGSNYGSQLDIAAPGVHMYSTDIQGAAGYASGDYYYDFNGTSSATPVVAGVGGLIYGICTNLNVSDVENILKQTADDLGTAGWDQYTGYGRVNAYEALMYTRSNYTCQTPFYWPMFMPAFAGGGGGSTPEPPQWGAGSEVCCPSSSATFSLTSSGITKKSVVADCSSAGTWEGWQATTPGNKSFSWVLSSAGCGSYSGSFSYTLSDDNTYYFQIELDGTDLVVYVYINAIRSAGPGEKEADQSKAKTAAEIKASMQLVGKIQLDIPQGTFSKSSCEIAR